MNMKPNGKSPLMFKRKEMGGTGWLLIAALWVPLLFTVILAFLAYRDRISHDGDTEWILHTLEVKDQLEDLNSRVKDVENYQKGYLLDGNASFLAAFEKTLPEIAGQSRTLAVLVADNFKQVAAAEHLRGLISAELSAAAQSVALAQQGKNAEAVRILTKGRGELEDEIAAEVNAMTAEETRLLAVRERTAASGENIQNDSMFGLVVTDIALIMGVTLLMLRVQKSRRMAEAQTAQANTQTVQANTQTEQANTRTEQAEARGEEAMRLSNLRYKGQFDAARDGILILDAGTGQVMDANPFLKELLGYSQEEMLGLKLWEIGPFKGEAASKITFAELQRTDLIRYEGLPLETKDGRRVEVEFISNAYMVGQNRFIQCNIRDISERKRAAGQIAEQATLLDQARDAILVRDLKGTILSWNKGAERMYGWARQEIVGGNMSDFYCTDRKKFEEFNRLTIRDGEWHGELRHLTKDGRSIAVEGRWTLIRDDEGNPKSVLIINTDVTEKKNIEAQFMRAQRMESIGTLAGGIAHDLNNILAPIMMAIEILKSTSSDPQAKSILETIEVSAQRGADIVRQVLTFARGIEGERIEVQPKHLLKDLENIIKNTFPKNIRLRLSVPNDTWTILGDPTQVHQILLNLCVNARDAMPDGGSLTIGVENCVIGENEPTMNIPAKAGRYIHISVNDTGAGIPKDILDKIFEPFFTTKDLDKGTGLGLSTVMAIVKSHDGTIKVYSEPGKGSTFNIYLPSMEMSAHAQKEQAYENSMPRGKDETILVVDDEASILAIATQTLQAFGYSVLTASDGAEAIAIFAQHRHNIAAVLTDMSMPVMDGASTINALLRISPTVKIIAASGLGANSTTARGAGPNVKHFLGKPYSAGTLLRVIRAALDES